MEENIATVLQMANKFPIPSRFMSHSSDLSAALDAVAKTLAARRTEILVNWRACVDADPLISGISHMNRKQFHDHIPLLLETFGQKLCDAPDRLNTSAAEARETDIVHQHSHHRWQQGYSVRSLVREWGHLNSCMTAMLDTLEAPAPVLAQTRVLWAEFVNQNISEGVAEYEQLLQSEAKGRLQDLEKALQTMSALEVARGEMLREVSHDLRGGLSMVAGASSLLGKDGIGDSDREQVVNILQGGVRSVTQMLSDLMDISRLEAGQEDRLIDYFDAGQLLQNLCENSEMLADEKKLWLHSQGPESLPVHGDGPKVQRIAQNLLLNALKYTHEGGVTVSWGEISAEQWYLAVSDTGPGLERSGTTPIARDIAQATQEAADIGAQAPQAEGETSQLTTIDNHQNQRASVNLATPGEGIGLSIVKRLCELLNATLELKSDPGSGSTFRVVFPRSY